MKRTKCCKFHNRLDKKFPDEAEEIRESDEFLGDEEEFSCGRKATTIDRMFCCEKCPSQIKIKLKK